MFRLSTASKLLIARQLRRVVGAAIAARGGDISNVRCRRRGVRWSLDLNEGVQLALYLGVYERDTVAALARLAAPGHTVIDIGANVGAQALPLAERIGPSGRLIAVEPTDSAMARLRANLDLNPALAERTVLVHRALGAAGDAPAGAYYSKWPLAAQGQSHPVHQGVAERSSAPCSTLDDLVDELGLSRVDLIKLDVDGYELPVLRGASATLKGHHPTVVMEVCPYLLQERGERPTALTQALREHGYRLYDERTFTPLPPSDAFEGAIPWGGSANVVASVRPLLLYD